MDKKEKIQWLKRYQQAEREILRLLDEMQQARSQSERVTRALSFTTGGKTQGNPIELVVEKMAEIQGKIVEAIYRQDAMKEEIAQAIAQLENPTQQQVLKCIYMNGYTIEKTAEINKYEQRQIYRIHNQGIENMSWNVTQKGARMIL